MPNKGRKFPAEPLTAEEVRHIIEGCSPKCPTGLRNRALITVLYRGGLRIGEALALKPKDAQDQTLRILHGKGDKSRMVGLDPGAWAILDRWVAERAKLQGVNGHDPLFCTLAGGPMSAIYVGQVLRRKAQAAGITKRVHSHGLRHHAAMQLVADGAPLNVVSAILGHASVATTNVYINHIANPQAVAFMQSRGASDQRKLELLRLREMIDKALATD